MLFRRIPWAAPYVALLLSAAAMAADSAWNGATDAAWSTTTNWSLGVPGTRDVAVFDGAGNGRTSISLGNGTAVAGIRFASASAASYTLGTSDQTLTLSTTGAGIAVATDVIAQQTLNAGLTLGATGTFSVLNSSSNLLTLAGPITGYATGTAVLMVAGAGNTAISGGITTTGGTVSLMKLGSGTLTLSGGGTFGGTAFVDAANLAVGTLFQEGVTSVAGGTFDNSGKNLTVGSFFTAGNAGTDVTLAVENGAAWTGINVFSIGRGNGTGTVSSDVVLNGNGSISAISATFGSNGNSSLNRPRMSLTLNDSSRLILSGSSLVIGYSAGSDATMTVNDSALVNMTFAATQATLGGGLTVARSGGTGTLLVDGGTVRANWVDIARGDNNTQTSVGTATIRNGGLLTCEGDFRMGFAGNASTRATVLIDSGTVRIASTTERWMILGRYDATNSAVTIANGGRLELNANSDIRFTQAGPNSGTNAFTLTDGVVTGYSDNGVTSDGTSVVDLNNGSTSASVKNTFNLDGGILTMRQVVTGNNAGLARLYLNGGLFRANGATDALISLGGTNQKAMVRNGGARVDTNGHTVTIPESLLHSDVGGDGANDGGLVKLGSGTLTLTGTNTYTGPTSIQLGRLNVTTSGSLGSGGLTLSDGAAFGVSVSGAANTQLATSSLTLGASTLSIDLAGFGNPVLAPLAVGGAMSVGGASVIDLATLSPALGTIPLISYGSLTGFANLSLGTLPLGMTASLIDNTAASTIDLVVTSLALPRWSGSVNGVWDVGLTPNWVNDVTGRQTTFVNGDPARFDDQAAGTTTVSISGTVLPGSVTVANESLVYSISGAGSIGGTGGLVKSGAAELTISTTNTFTGPVRIAGGRLTVSAIGNGGAAGPLGASSSAASNLVLAGGALVYTGGSATSNRGLSVTSGTSILEVVDAASTIALTGSTTATGGVFAKTGAGTLELTATANTLPETRVASGTLALTGPGSGATSQFTRVEGSLWAGAVPDQPASLVITNATLSVRDYFQVGRGTGLSGVVSTATVTNSAITAANLQLGYDNLIPGSWATQVLTLMDATLAVSGNTNIAYSDGSTSAVTLSGSSSVTSTNRTLLGLSSQSNGSLIIENDASFRTGGWLSIGNSGTGSVTVRDRGRLVGTGDFNVADLAGSTGTLEISDQASVAAGPVYVGKGVASAGAVTMTGGTFSGGSNSAFQIGLNGAGNWAQSGGIVEASGSVSVGGNAGGAGNLVLSGGTFSQTSASGLFTVGRDGTGNVLLSGGALALSGSSGLAIGSNASGYGTVALDGGVLTTARVQGGAGISSLSINAGTIKAADGAEGGAFMFGIGTVTIQSGGLRIDSNGQDLTVAQTLSGDGSAGGLTKLGQGLLTLSGQNSYHGLTTVAEGGLAITTATSGTGGYDLAGGASLDLHVTGYLGSQLSASTVTLGGLNTLGFDLGDFGNPTSAPLNVAGSLVTTGTITIDLATERPQLGQFSLVSYGSRVGSGLFQLGSLPTGVTGQLVDNVSGKSLDILITALASRQWNGLASGTPDGVWDVGATANWVVPPSDPSVFVDGDETVFNDLAQGTTAVVLNTTVSPNGVVISNDALAYTITGTGAIAGPAGLLKRGIGQAEIATANTFTGGVRVEGGLLSVSTFANGGVASPLGAATAAAGNIVLAGGTLGYGGPTATSDRGFSVTGTTGTIDIALVGSVLTLTGTTGGTTGTFAKTGPGTLTLAGGSNTLPDVRVVSGTLSLAGSGTSSARHATQIDGALWAGAVADQTAALTVSNARLVIRDHLQVGRGTGSTNTASTATLTNAEVTAAVLQLGYDAGLSGNLATQQLSLLDSVLTTTGNTNIAYSAGSTSTVTLSGSSSLISGSRTVLGLGSGAVGNLQVEGDSAFQTAGYLAIGNRGTGSLIVRDRAQLVSPGDFNVADLQGASGTLGISGSARLSTGAVYVGKSPETNGSVVMSGGTFDAGADANFQIGQYGTANWTQTGGVVRAKGWTSIARYEGSAGTMVLTGGTFNQTAANRGFFVGDVGTGMLTVSGSGVLSLTGATTGLTVGNAATAIGTVNLDGGRITTTIVREANGAQSTFNFNGGVLQAASSAQAAFMAGLDVAYVMGGGAIVDTNGHRVVIDQPLLDGGAGGGLTKVGLGLLALTGASTYTGTTAVNEGTLYVDAFLPSTRIAVASGAAIGGSGTATTVTLNAGSLLSPGDGVGAFTVTESLRLPGGCGYLWQLSDAIGAAGAKAGWDHLTVTGTLDITATSADPFQIDLWTLAAATPMTSGSAANFNPGGDYTWTIATAAGGITGFAADKFTIITGATNGTAGFANIFAGGAFSVTQSGSSLNLLFTHNAGPSTITINVASGTQNQTAAGYPTLSGSIPVVKTGGGTLVLDQANTLTGSTTIQAGVLRLANGSAAASSRLVPLAGGTVTLAAGSQTTVGGLAANAGGLTDVGSGLMTVAAGLSTADMLVALTAGRGDGSWNGATGITSTQAQADLAGSIPRTVGWLDNGDGSVTFAFAAPGDTNLDWNVDILDAANFLAGGKFDSGTPATWNEGDFGYDGVVDILDAADFLSTSLFDAGTYNGSSGSVAAVPEPAVLTIGLVAVALLGIGRPMTLRQASAGQRGP